MKPIVCVTREGFYRHLKNAHSIGQTFAVESALNDELNPDRFPYYRASFFDREPVKIVEQESPPIISATRTEVLLAVEPTSDKYYFIYTVIQK